MFGPQKKHPALFLLDDFSLWGKLDTAVHGDSAQTFECGELFGMGPGTWTVGAHATMDRHSLSCKR